MISVSISIIYLRYVGSGSGNTYGFGNDKDSPELVTKLFMEDELKEAPTHSHDIENLFRIEDSIITRFGAQVFKKLSDDLVIKYSHEMLPDPKVWCTRKASKLAKVLKEKQKEFNSKQSALKEAGVLMTDADILSKETQIQKYVQDCCSSRHKGPEDSPEEVGQMVEMYKGDEKLPRSALCKEIRFRKYSSYSIKFNNPLFTRQKVEMKILIENLKLLLMKTDLSMAAS